MDDLDSLRADLKRRLGIGRSTPGGAFGRAAVTSIADTVMGIPDAIVTSMAPTATGMDVMRPRELMEGGTVNLGPIDVMGRAVRSLSGGRVDPLAAGRAYVQDPVHLGDRVLPLPRGEQVVAGALAAKDFVTGDNFNPAAAYRTRMAEGEEMAQDHPFANAAGGVAGDIATLASGRLPFASNIAKAEKTLAALGPVGRNQTLTRDITRLFSSDPMKSLYRGMGRAAETGLEGATLSILKGGDPLEAGGYSAGAQVVGSMSMTATKALYKHPFIVSALGAAALFQVGKELTPGGENKFIPSLEAGFEHVAHGLIIGGLAALSTGRIRAADSSKVVQALADITTTTGRGAVLSLITDLTKEEEGGEGDVKRTITALTTTPDIFNETQLKRLQSAFDGQSFGATVKDMMKTDPRFAAAIKDGAADAGEELTALRQSLKRRLGGGEPLPRGFIGR